MVVLTHQTKLYKRSDISLRYFLIPRYTALDCAYVAEHLEVAEVLMEAGGLSVTKITEVAATKIQALARGYIIRKNRQRMKLWIQHRGEVFYSM